MENLIVKNNIGGNRIENYSTMGTQYLPVAEFYKGRHIFITGGTGFMGKVLLEKLLRSCPGIGNIYLLIRPKKGQLVNERLKQLLSSPLMEYIKQNNPTVLDHVVAIEGDITQPELGISNIDQQILFKNVSVVFHSAATVKFDEQLKLSVTINMLGTKRLVELCHKMQKLEALIHVSTAYCNCERPVISEEIYTQKIAPEHVTKLVDWLDEPVIDQLTSSLVGQRPNTYTFTKALAESMLLELANGLPVAIVRPSIVTSSLEGPTVGWVDNLNGPSGILAGAGKGIFRTMLGHAERVADFIPVDIVINTMLCAAWSTALRIQKSPSNPIIVYNVCSGRQKPITWGRFIDTCFIYMRKHPFSDVMWYPGGGFTSSAYVHSLKTFFYQRCPAYVMDAVAATLGKKPIMCKIQERLVKSSKCLEYFTSHEWEFKDDNVRTLNSLLSAADRKEFNIDVKTIDWDKYLEGYVLGIRHYIFKEKPDTLPKARAHMTRLIIIQRITQILTVIFLWRFLLVRSSHLRKLWTSAIYLLLRLISKLPGF